MPRLHDDRRHLCFYPISLSIIDIALCTSIMLCFLLYTLSYSHLIFFHDILLLNSYTHWLLLGYCLFSYFVFGPRVPKNAQVNENLVALAVPKKIYLSSACLT